MSETKTDPEDRKLARLVAKAIWKVQTSKELPEDPEARKKAWEEAKNGRIQEARRVVAQLERAGVKLTAPQNTDA